MILPVVTLNNPHHNTGIEHMTQIEIKQSKYGPHRFSNTSDEVDTNLPSPTHYQDNDISSDDSMSNTRKSSATHTRVCLLFSASDFNCCYGNRLRDQRVVVH